MGEVLIQHTDATLAQAIAPAEGGERRVLLRGALAGVFTRAAQASFFLTIALSPWRYRWTLLERPYYTVYGDYTDFLLFPADLTLLAAVCFWLSSRLLERRPIELGPRFLTLPLAGVLAAIWVSVPFSIDPALSFYHALRYLPLAGLYLLILGIRPRLPHLVIAAAAMIVSQAPIGILQVLGQRSLGLQELGEYALDPAWSGVSVVVAGGQRLLRAYSLTDHPNLLAGTLALCLLILMAGTLEASRRARFALLPVFGLGIVCLLMTFSRAAALAFAVSAALMVILAWRRRPAGELRRWLVLTAIGALVTLPFAASYASFIGSRLNASGSFQNEYTERRSLQERADLNKAANMIFADHALIGVGVGTLPRALAEREPEFTHYYQPAHIVLLNAAAETGLIGALFYAAALGVPWLALGLLYSRRARLPVELIAASALLLAVTVVGLFDYYPWLLQPGRVWQFAAWGLWGMSYLNTLQESPDD